MPPGEHPQRADALDRRDLLRKAALASAVGWTAPTIIASRAGAVFTPKCAARSVSASAIHAENACTRTNSTITVTITFAGTCPCGGEPTWCAQVNSPTGITASTNTNQLVYQITIPFRRTRTVSGRVAVGCRDRDGEMRFTRYDWSMTVTDNGQPCSVTPVNSITQPTLSGATTFDQSTCPSLAAAALLAAQSIEVTTETRPPG